MQKERETRMLNKCEATECGFTKCGLRIRAITDIAGSQVVITDDKSPEGTHLLSKPLENHEACITLGREVQHHGIDFYDEWGSPIGLFEFACLFAQKKGSEITKCH